jgi:hypothetical protein
LRNRAATVPVSPPHPPVTVSCRAGGPMIKPDAEAADIDHRQTGIAVKLDARQ